jgi:transposase-like protein
MSGKRVRRRSGVKEQFWRRAVAEYRRSGLTVREFCARRTLSEPSFYAWRRELAQRDGRASQETPPPTAEQHYATAFTSG